MKLFFTFLFITFTTILSHAQNREKAFEINEQLGRGINYGNMFEAPSENEWGNPWKPEYPEIISELGFNHVRIPIRWEPAERSSSQPPYNIYSSFLNRIKEVVDSSLNAGLYVVINMHHHEALFENPEEQDERFYAMWRQIAEFFQDYPDSLLFELLNEPHGNVTPEVWNDLVPQALDTIRKSNPERVVLIGTPEYGGLGGLPYLQIPDDENIILTVHYYNPFQFTHQGAEWAGSDADAWLGTKWQDSETEREVVRQEFAPLKALSEAENIPVHIGEFGAYSKADIVSREKWTTFLSRYFEELDWSWAYWEFSAGFGIYNPASKTFNQELVDALLHNEMPEPARYQGTEIYASDFASSKDGWSLGTSGSSSANMAVENGALNVAINSGGTETWHIQLRKGGFRLEKGKKYRYSFIAKSESARSVTNYLGMNSDPWSPYSGYNSANIADTFALYSYIFDMNSDTDNNARMIFDLGGSDADFVVSEIKIEEVELVIPTGAEVTKAFTTSFYPNPAQNKITINNSDNFRNITIIDVNGVRVFSKELRNNMNQIDISNLAPGMYFLQFSGDGKASTAKLLKR